MAVACKIPSRTAPIGPAVVVCAEVTRLQTQRSQLHALFTTAYLWVVLVCSGMPYKMIISISDWLWYMSVHLEE